MAFTSLSFLGFVLAVVLVVNAVKTPRTRAWLMLPANLVFLASYVGRPIELVPLLGFGALGYGFIELLRRTRSSAWLWFGLLVVVGTFVTLKKYAFVPAAFTLPGIYSVIGLSYVLFRVLHLMVDAKQGELTGRVDPLSYINYTASFLTLVAGPIQRFKEFERETGAVRPLEEAEVYAAFARIIQGFLRIAVVSAAFDYVFAALSPRVLPAAVALPWPQLVGYYAASAVSYTVFLYANFAGYMDVVVGVGALLGQKLPENFDHPFQARSFLDFWARWHITLSTWFRMYVFNPLLRVLATHVSSAALAPYLAVVAFFITFLLMGVWHGATSVFVVYGLYMGAGASVNKLWQLQAAKRLGKARYKALGEKPLAIYVSRGLTFAYFALGLSCLWLSLSELAALSSRLGVGGWLLCYLGLTGSAALGFAAWDGAGSVLTKLRNQRGWESGAMGRNLLLAAQILMISCISSFFH
ncbi:MAG TPA: MBOAT family O-acyltransferase, partial [Polyangiaceae bacterium]|nr:MBOAT family O-acyltransferase [Polyangiaceae bacterium]